MKQLLTVSSSPHIHAPDSTRSIMLNVIVALVPSLIWGIYVFGVRAAAVVAVSCVCCVLFEWLYRLILKKPNSITDCSALLTGLLLGLNMPASVPLWLPAVGAFFAVVIVKQLFGGLGKNFLNPALAARAFLFSWPTEMTKFTAPFASLPLFSSCDAYATATPLASLAEGTSPNYTIADMFFGNIPGCIGEVSALLLVVGGIYLIVRRIITWHIPVAYLGTVAILSYVFPCSEQLGPNGSMMYSLLSGGLILGAFFMATDYVTSPVNPSGKLIYGIGCGLLTLLIRTYGGYSEGVSFAILIMNLLVNYIDKLTKPVPFGMQKTENGAKKSDKSNKSNKSEVDG